MFVAHLAELPEVLAGLCRDGDVILTLGAGDIGREAANLGRTAEHAA